MAGPTFVGGLVNPNPTLNGYTLQDGVRVVATTSMGSGTEIDVTKPESTKSLTSSPTLTFSNATPTAGTEFRLVLSADSSARTATIPSTYDVNRQGDITTLYVPANNTVVVPFKYTGARWECFGPGGTPYREHFEISFDPKAVCDGAVDRLFLFKIGDWAPNGINILAWRLSFEADPTTELDANAKLKRATAFIGVGSAADMDVIQTTNGVASESTPANINGGATVANGQVVYLEFGTAYTEATHQIIFEMEYSIA